MSKADDAKAAVAHALAFLREDMGGEQARRDLDIQLQGSGSPQDQAALKRAMEQACPTAWRCSVQAWLLLAAHCEREH